MVGYKSMLLRNIASRLSAVNADSRAFATVAVTAAITSRYSRWFDMQAGVAKFTKGFTKRPAKGLLGVPT